MTTKDHEQKLKRFLVKCLPEELHCAPGKFIYLYWLDRSGFVGASVKDTELLDLCHRIEMRLSDEDARDFRSRLMLNAAGHTPNYRTVESALCHATWIERAEALAELKGEKL